MDTKLAARETLKLMVGSGAPWPRVEGKEEINPAHIMRMLEQVESGEIWGEKAHRWVGYAQGVLLCKTDLTLEDVKYVNHNA